MGEDLAKIVEHKCSVCHNICTSEEQWIRAHYTENAAQWSSRPLLSGVTGHRGRLQSTPSESVENVEIQRASRHDLL